MDRTAARNLATFAHRHDVAPHEHAVFVYRDQDDMLVPLERFLDAGVKARDLSVFVHSFSDNEGARTFLGKRLGQELVGRERAGHLAASHYREAFERGGRIDYDHVGGVVEMLRESARATGRRAPRIFVDASKNYFDAGRVDEWFAFESWLGPRLAAEAGLVCAYREKDLQDPATLQRVLETHAYRFTV